MERDGFFTGAPNPAPAEMNCGPSEHVLQPCYLNLNWDHPIEQSSRFESALSSIVSSPSSLSVAASGAENVVIRELIGRLGSICKSGEISPQPHPYLNGGNSSAAASCYSTPLGSPSKLNIFALGNAPAPGDQMAQMDPGFTERAMRLSSFYGGLPGQFDLPEVASRVSSNQSLVGGGLQVRSPLEVSMRPKSDAGLSNSSAMDNGEESSVSNRTMASRDAGSQGAGESSGRKRKAAQRGKAKDSALCSTTKEVAAKEDANVKRIKSSENVATAKDEVKPKIEQCSGSDIADGDRKPGKENNNPKPPEPPKQDYIHVRARRGQATDSHSLAERVRREKISERMKFLQDLVPGCNKLTGKAVMLDEIINYVQSLQRQVEFLSMKLAAVDPSLDFNVDNLLQKDSLRPLGLLSHESLPIEMPGPVLPFAQPPPPQGSLVQSILSSGMENLCSVNPLDASLRTPFSLQLPRLDGFADGTSQVANYWDDGLIHHVVQMGFGQNQEAAAFSSQPFHGAIPNSTMEVEL